MQGRGIKISAIGPNESLNFGVNLNLIEHGKITQRSVECTNKHKLKVDSLFTAVIKRNMQRVWPDNFDGTNTVNRVRTHLMAPDAAQRKARK